MSDARRPTPTTFTPRDPIARETPKLLGVPIWRVVMLCVIALVLPFAVAFVLSGIHLRASAHTNDSAVATNDNIPPASPSPDPYDDGSDGVTTQSNAALPSKRQMTSRHESSQDSAAPSSSYPSDGTDDPNTSGPRTTFHPNVSGTTSDTGSQPMQVASPTPAPYLVTVIGSSGATTSSAATPAANADPGPSSSVVKDLQKTASAHEQVPMLTPFIITAHTYLPAALTSDVNSDFPGAPTAMITSDVYDSTRQGNLLVPAGTIAEGKYVSAPVFGQNRIFVLWERLKLPPSRDYPNGSFVLLDDFPSTDQAGASAINANVDNHWGNVIGPAIWLSALQAGTLLAGGPNAYGPTGFNQFPSPAQLYVQSLAQQLLNTGIKVSERSLAQVPTLKISAGEPFHIEVLNDMRFRGPFVAEGVQQ